MSILLSAAVGNAAFAAPLEWDDAAGEGGDDAVYDPFAHLGEDGVPPEETHVYEQAQRVGFSLAPALDYRYIRVMLTTSHVEATVNFHGNYALYDASDAPVFRVASDTDYAIVVSGGALEVRSADGTALYRAEAFYFKEFAPDAGEAENYFKVYSVNGTDNCYKGELNCWYATSEDGLETEATGLFLVNRVYMEEYLKGVLPYEIGDGSGAEALKAQAVVARNYAVRSIRSTNIFDVYDTSRSQVYRGIPSNAPNSEAAVEATEGIVLTYNGSTIKAYFSASNGGYTELSTNQWSGEGNSGPETIREDPYDLAYARANTYGSTSKPYLEEVTIPKTPLGTETEVQALIANALLPALTAYPGLTAAEVTVSSIAIALNNTCTSIACTRHHSGSAVCSHFCGIDVTFSGAILANGTTRPENIPFTGVAAHIADTDLYVSPSSGVSYGFFTNGDLGKYWLFESDTGYTIRHARYGHGVGLSQIGATQMAAQGMGYEAILGFYFEGCTLAKHSGITAADALPALSTVERFAKNICVLTHDAAVLARANEQAVTLGVLRAGTCVELLATGSSYSRIEYQGADGYILNTTYENVSLSHVRIENVTSNCRVRSGPGSTYTTLGRAYLGETYVLEQANVATGWHRITYNGQSGYVFSKYARLLTPAAAGAETPLAVYPVRVELPAGYADATLWLDGVQHFGTIENGVLTANAYSAEARTAVAYCYDGTVPTGMAVWLLSFEGGAYAAQRVSGLDDLLSYHGFSARIRGESGIRFKSGIARATRTALRAEGIEGYTLVEYGTVAFTSTSRDFRYYPFLLENGFTGYGRSFWYVDGVAHDRIVEEVDGRIRFSSVLTGLPDNRLNTDFPFRAYIILTNGADTITLYGAPMSRSIYTIAKRTMAGSYYAPESEEAIFLNRIIQVVEAE